jgi:hypothetical protein
MPSKTIPSNRKIKVKGKVKTRGSKNRKVKATANTP